MKIFTCIFSSFRVILFGYLAGKLYYQYRNSETSTSFQDLDDELEKVLPGLDICSRHDSEMTLRQMIEESNKTELVEHLFISGYDSVVENMTEWVKKEMVWFFNSLYSCFIINLQKGML